MTTERKRTGRPRRIQKTTSLSPVEELLLAAGQLFSEQGFSGTSTREIAARAGLGHGSIFHYFATKEDLLLALSERALQVPLHNLAWLETADARPGAKLWALIDLQVRHLCAQPYDLTPLLQDSLRLPRERFSQWYDDLDRYTHGVERLVAAGIERGEFSPQVPVIATMAILGMVIWTIRWYDASGPISAEDLGAAFASFALRSLAQDRRTVAAIESEGRRLAAAVPPLLAAPEPEGPPDALGQVGG